MSDEGIVTNETPSAESFGFTEIAQDTRPYKMAGYVEGVCPDATNPFGYTPPNGWFVSSCTWMPPGSHGVPVGRPAILVYCEPIRNGIPPIDPGELTSIMYPDPSDRKEIAGRAYSIPDASGFFIEQYNYIRYAMYGRSLSDFGYVEGEQVVAYVILSPVYEDIIDVDQWGYVAELINIRKVGEPEKLPYQGDNKTLRNTILILTAVGAIVATAIGALIVET